MAAWCSMARSILLRGRPLVSYASGFVSKLLWGTANHLWYLPFAFVILVLLDRLRGLVSKGNFATACGLLAIVSLATAEWWREPSFSLGFPWATFVHAMPAVFLGIFVWEDSPFGSRFAGASSS